MEGRQLLAALMSIIIITPTLGAAMAAEGSTGQPSPTMVQDDVSDDWTDEYDEAEAVNPNQEYNGVIDSNDDRDYLRVPVEEGDTVHLTLEKEIRKDTKMRVDWPGGGTTVSDESEGTITRKVTVEENGFVTIYVRSSSTSASEPEPWTLSINHTEGADEWGDDSNNAEVLDAGASASGVVNSPDDRDYMVVPVNEGDVVTLELTKVIRKDTKMRVDWPGGGTTISDESEDTLTRKVTVEEDGELVVYIRSPSVEIEPEEWSLAISIDEGADQWNDASNTADEIESGERYTGVINSPDDRDYLQLPVEQGDTVTTQLNKTANADTKMRVDWPGGGTTVSDESEDMLTRKVTVEENGFVTIYVRNPSGGMDAGDWAVETSHARGADEWRDSSANADEVNMNSQHTGYVNSPDDRDYLRAPVETGDTFSLALRKEIRKDTKLRVDWPGGGTTVSDESRETLSYSGTAEENGFITAYVRSSSVEVNPEPWALSIADGEGAQAPELPAEVNSPDGSSAPRNTEAPVESGNSDNQTDTGSAEPTATETRSENETVSPDAENRTSTVGNSSNASTEAPVRLDPEYGIATTAYDTGTIAGTTSFPGLDTVAVHNESDVDADTGTITFNQRTEASLGYHAISTSGVGALGADYEANESGTHNITAEFTIDELRAQAKTDLTPVVSQASAARAGHSVHTTVSVYDKTDGQEVASETIEVQDAVTPDLTRTLVKRSLQTVAAKLGGSLVGEKVSAITDSGAAGWTASQLTEVGLELGSDKLATVFEEDVHHTTTDEPHQVDVSFEAEEDHEYLVDVKFHTQTAVSALNHGAAGSNVNLNATVDGFTVDQSPRSDARRPTSTNTTAPDVAIPPTS